MRQSIYTVKDNREIASKIWRMRLAGDTSALKRGGQFVEVSVPGRFLRRPFAAQEWDSEGFSLIYKVIGGGTEIMTSILPGEELDVITGCGNGFNAGACREKALVVCGGLGASPAFSLVRELVASGKKVSVILGFNTEADIFLTEEYKELGADVTVVTADGSVGLKGFVTDAIKVLNPEYDFFYTCGPAVMMKAVCGLLEGGGQVSLEERMGCGAGFCYGCTCNTISGPKRVCADGPVFNKEEVIW